MRRKIVALNLALLLILSLLPIKVLAAATGIILEQRITFNEPNPDGYSFTPDKDGLYTFKRTDFATWGSLQIYNTSSQLLAEKKAEDVTAQLKTGNTYIIKWVPYGAPRNYADFTYGFYASYDGQGQAGAPAISSIKSDKTSAAEGEKITWTATASGGTGTLKHYFILYKDGTKIKTQAYSTKNTFSYTPTEPGTYKVKVYVKDSADKKVYKTSTGVTVTEAVAALTISSIKADKSSAAAGEKITWTATASGGTGTLQYYFILYKDGTKLKTRSYSTTKTFSYTPTEAGTYKVRVYVKDSADNKVNKLSSAVEVTSGTSALAISGVKANKTSVSAGEKITWTATASGGTGTLKYYFILYKDGTKLTTRAYSTASTFSYTLTEAGTYRVRVYVKDTADNKVNKLSTAVTVTG